MVVGGDDEVAVRWSRCLLSACVGYHESLVEGNERRWMGRGVEPLRLVFRVRDCVLLLLGEYSMKP